MVNSSPDRRTGSCLILSIQIVRCFTSVPQWRLHARLMLFQAQCVCVLCAGGEIIDNYATNKAAASRYTRPPTTESQPRAE